AQDRRLTSALAVASGLLLLLDLKTFLSITAMSPHGGWDAWAIWNMRARFLFRAAHWRDGFTEALAWSHPDYPLLLPALVARGWKLAGREPQAVPITIAWFFTFGSVGLAASSLAILREIPQALLACIAVSAAPILFVQGANQYADVVVAFFILATLAAMAL